MKKSLARGAAVAFLSAATVLPLAGAAQALPGGPSWNHPDNNHHHCRHHHHRHHHRHWLDGWNDGWIRDGHHKGLGRLTWFH